MKHFTMLDENWDGKITLEELETVMKKSGKTLSADELKTVIAAMDDNGNTNYLKKFLFLMLG